MASRHAHSRRALLAALAGSTAAASGCVGEARNLLGRDRTEQLSLRIVTLPASEDPYAVRIATRLADNLERSGIAALVDPIRPDVLFRETLINHDFDLYVSRYPSRGDPDELRSMLYSAYAEEAGWQNPFGFSDLTLDDLLDDQRAREGTERIDRIHEIQRHVLRTQPFTVVCFPDRIGATRTDRFSGWPAGGLDQPMDYAKLDRTGSRSTLELVLRNDRITANRNPIAAEHRNRGSIVGLMYDPLVRPLRGSPEPIDWLAESITWGRTDGGEALSASVRVRETPWHDGTPLTARDVAFSYEFLRDTSLGGFETPAPTPWCRGRVSLVDAVRVYNDRLLEFDFATGVRPVAQRALSVPILPEHVWRERADPAEIAGIDVVGQTTEALVDANEAAIGSGPFRLADAVVDESITLETFPDHFLYGEQPDGIPDRFSGDPPFDTVRFTVAPSDDTAVEVLLNDNADASADGLQARVVPRIVRSDDVSLTVRRSDRFYHIGYNCRRAPTTDPNFRRAVAGHIDRRTIVTESLGGYGTPAQAPLRGKWVPDGLQLNGPAAIPFLGTNGALDADAARETFREAGYRYEGDELITRATP